MGETMRFEGKIALITAAANGIGRATAVIMAAEGATVVCVDNHPERLGSAVAALGKQAHGRLCDALDQRQVDAVVADVVREFGRIDILVNAVGGSTIIAKPSATVEEHSLDDWQRVIKFNLDGTFLFTHAVVPIMKGQKAGKIVNLASIAGRGMSVASGVAYAAAKGGIIALTRKLSFEVGPFGININAIAPSLTLTERIRPHWNQRSPEAQAAQVEATPLRRVAEAADQAKVICFLASSDADFVTGLTIDVTGGQSG
jgi:NAD(P)-dependent dehydrogenase (short-subunit alcohol dehydrogenase family)